MQLIVFGPPGAGKGTQAKLLSSYLSIPHLSTGDILRSKLNEKDEISIKLQSIMSSGNLVSDNILNQIVSEKIISKEPLLLEINNDVNTDNEHKKFLPMKEQKKKNV